MPRKMTKTQAKRKINAIRAKGMDLYMQGYIGLSDFEKIRKLTTAAHKRL